MNDLTKIFFLIILQKEYFFLVEFKKYACFSLVQRAVHKIFHEFEDSGCLLSLGGGLRLTSFKQKYAYSLLNISVVI